MNFDSNKVELAIAPEELQNFYSSQAKIIISECDRDYFSKNINPNNLINVYTFQYDQQLQTGTIKNINDRDNSNLVKIELIPTSSISLLSFTTVGKATIDKFYSWCLTTKNNNFIADIIELNPKQEPAKIQADFWQQLYKKKQAETQAIALRNATLQKQYLNLRTLHENMQNAFAAVEEYLTQARLPELQLAFDNQHAQKSINLGHVSQSNSFTIKQLLPVSSRGLAVVDLLLHRTDPNSVGDLIVQLKYCENKTSFAKWQIPYQQLPNGWLSLDLPNIDIGRKRDVELNIDWNTQSGNPPYLMLGKKQLIPELSLRAIFG